MSSYSIIVFCFYFYRCQKWVENCRRADLEDKTPDQLNKHYRLCAKHFETSMICRTVSNQRACFFFVLYSLTYSLFGWNVNLYILMLETILTPCHFFFFLRWRQIWSLIVSILFLKTCFFFNPSVSDAPFLLTRGSHF